MRFPMPTSGSTATTGRIFRPMWSTRSFRGQNRVQQQRAVYAALKGKMDGTDGDLHALALTTKAPA